MRKKEIPALSRAQRTGRRLANPKLAGLPQECHSQVKVRVAARRRALFHSSDDLRSYFILFARNRYASVHYELTRVRTHTILQQLHAARQDSGSCTTPPGVEQGDRALPGRDKVDRDAIGDRDKQE